jgi:hypothetical protein
MRARGTASALATVAAATLATLVAGSLGACLGYGSPVDEGFEPGAPLPERGTLEDSGVAAPPPPPPAATDAATVDVDAGTGDAARAPLRAFVTSQTKTGNLGGVAAADQLCTSLATAAGLGGTYRAWLSVSGADAIDHVTSVGPWQLVTGDVVAADKAGLAAAQLKHLVNRDEKGATPPDAEDRVWTGTGSNGRYVGPDCAQWTGAGAGLVGEAKNGGSGNWTALGNESCTEVNRVYCFEL